MTKHMLLGHEPDIIADWPPQGIVLDGDTWEVCRCSRCEELAIGIHGEEHWRDNGVSHDKHGRMRTLRRCIGIDSQAGLLRRNPLNN